MPEPFFALNAPDQREAVLVAASHSGRPAHLLEKDIWVVWTLQMLYESPFGEHLVFKGGTSLSKAYGAIGRFSEDVDLTYDIRTIAGDLIGNTGNIYPPTRSQGQKWTKTIRDRLIEWVEKTAQPYLSVEAARHGLSCEIEAHAQNIHVRYEPHAIGTGYVSPQVILEFGARATGEPWEMRQITTYAGERLPTVSFPIATARVMRPERTFWEKATAIHVFCKAGEFGQAARFSRHWYDLVGLDDGGYANAAIADRELAQAVALHKGAFFREKTALGEWVDYEAAVSGSLQLLPTSGAADALATDYEGMLADGLIFEEPPKFQALLERVSAIESRANAAR